MAIQSQKPTKERVLVPQGTHVGRVWKIMNLGTRFQEYKGVRKEYPDTLINISWELPNEMHEFTFRKEDGSEEKVTKPMSISREFTLSMGSKSNLRPIVEGIIGTALSDDEAYGFDVETLLGMASLVTVTHRMNHEGKVYANLISTAPLLKGMEEPAAVNEPKILDVRKMTKEEIDALPEWLGDKMRESDEYKVRFEAPRSENPQRVALDPEHEAIRDLDPESIPF
jgi:hypothetical protein